MKKKILKIILSIVLILILAVGIGLTYLVGAAGGGGPFDFVWKNKLKKMPGNAEKYSLENIEPLENSPLGGKRICYLGSSVTLGLYSMDVSFADYISYRNGCEYVKEAVSGTTLVDNGKTSYIQRMKNNIGTDEKFDAFVCQLSTNDASKEMPIGELSRSENLEDFDTYYWGDHGNNIVPQKGYFPLLKNRFLKNIEKEIRTSPIVDEEVLQTFAW